MIELDASQIAQALRERHARPGRCRGRLPARIAERNPVLNAVVGSETANLPAELAQLRQRIARREPLPLAGVPVVVKDVIWVEGERVTQGSLLFAISLRRGMHWRSNVCVAPGPW